MFPGSRKLRAKRHDIVSNLELDTPISHPLKPNPFHSALHTHIHYTNGLDLNWSTNMRLTLVPDTKAEPFEGLRSTVALAWGCSRVKKARET